MTTQKITKTILDKVSGFVGYYEPFSILRPIKLSDLYNSRTTRYHSIYNTDLFVIKYNKEDIVAAGYSPLCKAIISLNINNDVVKQAIELIISERRKRDQEARIREEEKQAFAAAVLEEANSITIDEKFKSALQWASEVSGNEKSDRMASAMKGLIDRNGIAEIKTDFWKVFRILKDRSL